MDSLRDTEDEDLNRLKKATADLGEHFDCVHIFASRYLPEEEGKTMSCSYGTGHWFARYGHIREWLIQADQRSKKEVYEE
jgi:hypothetical protein